MRILAGSRLLARAPLVDEPDAFLEDHKAEQDHLACLCEQARAARDGDEVELAAFRNELEQVVNAGAEHIERENTVVFPDLAQRLSPPEQGEIVGKVLGAIPKEAMPALVPWIVVRQSDDEAEAYVRGLMAAMPAAAFGAAKGWIEGGIDGARGTELRRRVPELAA